MNLSDATILDTQIFVDDFTICKEGIKAFTQWTKDHFGLRINPTSLAFPADTTTELLLRVKTHNMFVACSYSIASASKPEKLTKDKKWENWAPYFLNYLRAIPGRDGVPLKYIVRAKKLPNPTTQAVIDSIVTTRKIGSSPIIWNQSQEQQQLMSAT